MKSIATTSKLITTPVIRALIITALTLLLTLIFQDKYLFFCFLAIISYCFILMNKSYASLKDNDVFICNIIFYSILFLYLEFILMFSNIHGYSWYQELIDNVFFWFPNVVIENSLSINKIQHNKSSVLILGALITNFFFISAFYYLKNIINKNIK